MCTIRGSIFSLKVVLSGHGRIQTLSLRLFAYSNTKGVGQPGHPCTLINVLIVRGLERECPIVLYARVQAFFAVPSSLCIYLATTMDKFCCDKP